MRRALVAAAVSAVVLAATSVVVVVVAGVRVTGTSMSPTLADGDRVVINPFDGSPSRFALVAVRLTDGGPLAVKRVVGLPGDRLRIQPPDVFVQPGGARPWHRVDNPAWRGRWHRDGLSVETAVAGDAVFVLGDNLGASEDSLTFGAVPLDRVAGTVRLRLYPPGGLGGGDVRLEPLEADG